MKTQRNILIAFLLNFFFSVVELVGGLYTGSVAILSDAIHDMGDAVSIGLSFGLEKKAAQRPDNRYTYGYGRFSVLGAAITNGILLVGSVGVAYQGIHRLFNPQPIHENGMIVMAVFGVVVNFAAAYVTRGGQSMNQKAVNLHMLEDVLGWAVVLVGALVIRLTNWVFIDALMSIGVAVYILLHALSGMKEVLELLLEKVPNGVEVDEIQKHLKHIPQVQDVHHLHLWSLDGQNHCATLHVVAMPQDYVAVKEAVREELQEHGISHVTVELETPQEQCRHRHCEITAPCGQGSHHHHHH